MRPGKRFPSQAGRQCSIEGMQMKKHALFLLCILFLLAGCSTANVEELYGTWYNDTGDIRNAIQFYAYDTTENAFIWAVYDIAADERTSIDTGTYELSDGTITFTYASGTAVTLDYIRDGDSLTLTMDGAAVEFRLYELEDTTA